MKKAEPNAAAASKDDKTLKVFGGSRFDSWNHVLIDQALQSLWTGTSPDDKRDCQMDATVFALGGIRPRDELEGMMAAQLIAAHNATMECFRRSMLANQSFEGRREALNQANKLSRTYATLLDALNKHRGKGQQKMTVEHVHVYAGGQAVVGTIQHQGVGGSKKLEEQPYAQQITYAPEFTLWGNDTGAEAVPIPRDGEWSLPHAWGEISGGTEEEF